MGYAMETVRALGTSSKSKTTANLRRGIQGILTPERHLRVPFSSPSSTPAPSTVKGLLCLFKARRCLLDITSQFQSSTVHLFGLRYSTQIQISPILFLIRARQTPSQQNEDYNDSRYPFRLLPRSTVKHAMGQASNGSAARPSSRSNQQLEQ